MAKIVIHFSKRGAEFISEKEGDAFLIGHWKDRFFRSSLYFMDDINETRVFDIYRTAKFPSKKRPIGHFISPNENKKHEMWWKESIFKSSYKYVTQELELSIYDHQGHDRSTWVKNRWANSRKNMFMAMIKKRW